MPHGDVCIYWLDKDFKFSKMLKLDEYDLGRLVTALENLDAIDEYWG